MLRLDLDAEIVPNQSLGGLQLRTNIGDLSQSILSLINANEASFELAYPFEARYKLAKGALEIAVDVQNGKIYKLVAGKGYKGRLFKGISVGMSVADAMATEPRLYYSETEEGILCRGVEGVFIDIPEIDPPAELVPTLTISAISVFASDARTAAGFRGNW